MYRRRYELEPKLNIKNNSNSNDGNKHSYVTILLRIGDHEASVARAFLSIILISCFIGYLLYKICQYNAQQLRVRDGFLIVTLCWLLSTIMGAVPFVVTGSIPSFTDAFFESASGFSTTGGSILTDIEALPRCILFWRSFTHWIGGM